MKTIKQLETRKNKILNELEKILSKEYFNKIIEILEIEYELTKKENC